MGVDFTPIERREEVEEVGDWFSMSYTTFGVLCSALEDIGLPELAKKLDNLAYEGGVLEEPDRIRLMKALNRILRLRKRTWVYSYGKRKKEKVKLTLGKREKTMLRHFLDFLKEYRDYDILVG